FLHNLHFIQGLIYIFEIGLFGNQGGKPAARFSKGYALLDHIKYKPSLSALCPQFDTFSAKIQFGFPYLLVLKVTKFPEGPCLRFLQGSMKGRITDGNIDAFPFLKN